MKLPQWMKVEDKSVAWVAKRLRVTEVSVIRYCNGTRKPVDPVMRRIIKMTSGLVTANDFLGPIRRRPKRTAAVVSVSP